jgi:Rieske Fe-S protein
MPGEDQERFEDYLELEQYIEELQAGHVAHPPTELTPSQVRIYRMAALFRSASPGGAELRPDFVAQLQARLEQELEEKQSVPTQPLPVVREKKPWQILKRPGHVSRRALLTGGAAAAASLVVGAGIERVAEQVANGTTQDHPPATTGPLIQQGVPTTWHFVTAVALLQDAPVRFVTDAIIGYVVRADEDAPVEDRGKIIAMSAACTHMGCIVQWKGSDRKYHCPCHEWQFTEYGKLESSRGYSNPLPRLETKVEDGKIYVKVPVG